MENLENEIEVTYNYLRGSWTGRNFENRIIKTILFSKMPIFGQKKL